MNSFSFNSSGQYFICPSILNDSFAGQSNLGSRPLPFMTWNTSCQPLLACNISFEKSAYSLMGTPLQVTLCLSLAAFKILSLSLTFVILIMMCLGVVLFGYNLFGTLLCFLDLYVYLLCQIREGFFYYYFSNKFLISCSSSSPSGIQMIQMLALLEMFQSCLILSSFFFFLNSCFFILLQLNVYFFLVFQIVDLNPSFFPFTAGTLQIYLYFTQCNLHFFPLCCHTQ